MTGWSLVLGAYFEYYIVMSFHLFYGADQAFYIIVFGVQFCFTGLYRRDF